MITRTYQYLGDPVTEVELMFGQEFLAQADKPREIVIYGVDLETHIPVREIVCDLCNNLVGLTDPCALAHNYLYCWSCYEEWIKPYLFEVQ